MNNDSKPSTPTAHSRSDPQQSGTSSYDSRNPFNLDQLSNAISKIVMDQNRIMLHQFQNPGTDNKNEKDQIIEDKYLKNLTDLDKIPDVVKCIREFAGQPGEFSSWKKSVDRVLTIYENLKETPKYYGILNVIRNKIVGQADIVLESYNTPLNWQKIARCLTLHYADKRDLGTLEYQMTTLIQGNQTLQEFYQGVYQHLSLILNKLSCMEMGQESINNMTECYRDKALDTFIRGLKGDLPRLLSIREPTDLPQALYLCLKLQNVDFRTQYAHNNHQNTQRRPQTLPSPQPKFMHQNSNQILNLPQRFYPQLLHNPQSYFDRSPLYSSNRVQPRFSNPHFQRQTPQPNRHQPGYPNYPPRYPPKPESKPIPMEVDSSAYSRRVNYMNHPHNKLGATKRPFQNQSQQVQHPNKFQWIYHQEQSGEYPDMQYYQDQLTEYDAQYDQSFVEYTDSYETPVIPYEPDSTEYSQEQEETEQLDDVNFLD